MNAPATLTADELDEVCSVVMGERWQSALARHWQIDIRLVRRWANKDRPFPPSRIPMLRALLAERREQLDRVDALLAARA